MKAHGREGSVGVERSTSCMADEVRVLSWSLLLQLRGRLD
jgi:hypothetical protein